MLSRTADYAVRAAVLLARHRGERLVSADEIASVVGAPRNYMAKTLNVLVRRGILTSMRGPGGGFALAVPADILTVSAVIDVFADVRPPAARCLLEDRACNLDAPCSAHGRWMTITRIARGPLVEMTIGELCGTHRYTSASNKG
jgi:Rrf2 family iron-sulfur cluster assembly transcriptional regulator